MIGAVPASAESPAPKQIQSYFWDAAEAFLERRLSPTKITVTVDGALTFHRISASCRSSDGDTEILTETAEHLTVLHPALKKIFRPNI